MAIALAGFAGALQASPWMPSPIIGPVPTAGVPSGPDPHPGKEYSSEIDADAAGAAKPGQVVLWDGAGGTADGVLVLPPAGVLFEIDVDAIANHGDALFDAVVIDGTAQAFSLREVVKPTGPGTPGVGVPGLPPPGAGVDHLAASIFYETTGGAIGTWATPVVVNDTAPPTNVDGIEIWGPEGAASSDSDTDRYSLAGDSFFGTSIFNLDGSTYLSHFDLWSGMTLFDSLLEPYQELLDLDALMVKDEGTVGTWDAGDVILFSLWPFFDLDSGFDYWGDAVYVWAFGASPALHVHGGHVWANGWTIAEFGEAWNVDGLEALAFQDRPPPVPEPATLLLTGLGLGLGLAGLGFARRRRAR